MGTNESSQHDGTSQRDRFLPALDPGSVRIDERGHADMLRYVRELAASIPFVYEKPTQPTSNWRDFACNDDIDEGRIVAYMQAAAIEAEADRAEALARFTDDELQWLGRPHFALLLAFLERMGQARDHLNGITARHLDHYYREVLRIVPAKAVPDRVAVAFGLAPRIEALHLPAGTPLQAGRDASGVPQVYRTERELDVNRARVTDLWRVFVERKVTRLSDIWAHDGDDMETPLNHMLELALGTAPESFKDSWVDYLGAIADGLRFAGDQLCAEHHELRRLLRLDSWWKTPPAGSTPENIAQTKDAIVRIATAMGRRKHKDPHFSPKEPDPFDLDQLIQAAVGEPMVGIGWPWKERGLPWPSGLDMGIVGYEQRLRWLEGVLHLRVERIAELAGLVAVAGKAQGSAWLFSLERLLTQALGERTSVGRRAAISSAAGTEGGAGDKFRRALQYVLGKHLDQSASTSTPWQWAGSEERKLLGNREWLDRAHLALLDGFVAQAEASTSDAAWLYTWDDVVRVLEVAQRNLQRLPEPVVEQSEILGIHAEKCVEQGASKLDGAELAATIGCAITSPVLALSQGTRRITLTLGFSGAKEELDRLGAALTWQKDTARHPLRCEISTSRGWIVLETNGGTFRAEESQLVLVLTLEGGPALPAFEPGEGSGDRWPTLRLVLRSGFEAPSFELLDLLSALELRSVDVAVEVEGLTDVRIQHEDRPLDPRKPFLPWGRQPGAGSRMALTHPELVRSSLASMTLTIDWQPPSRELSSLYANYDPKVPDPPRVRLASIDRLAPSLEQPEAVDVDFAGQSSPELAVSWAHWPDARAERDIHASRRYFELTLETDLGHAIYPTIAAKKARELAIAIAKDPTTVGELSGYTVHPPYTPMITRLVVGYSRTARIHPVPDEESRLLHVHPFGVGRVGAKSGLFPTYGTTNETYIGLSDVGSNRRISLYLHVAPRDGETPGASWSVLDSDDWTPVTVRHDSTRGLVGSGIVELDLPPVGRSTLLPGDRYWLRICTEDSTCQILDARAQAAMLVFDDHGSNLMHYDEPLATGGIKGLLTNDARLASVEQLHASFGGKAPEDAKQPQEFRRRVSERLRHRRRAIGPWDYERLVLEEFPQIYKVKCRRATEEPGLVEVLVVPDVRRLEPAPREPRASAELLATIRDFLLARASSQARVVVRNATFVPVSVRLAVRFSEGWDIGHARKQLNEDLVRHLSPWAFDDVAGISIGGKIYANSILDYADRRDYVDYVTNIVLRREHDDTIYRETVSAGPSEVLVSAKEHIIDVIEGLDYQPTVFVGIGYMKIGFDFRVG